MVKTQIQLPDRLYQEAKRVARERELSFAEVVRRGLEYITRVYPPAPGPSADWAPPAPHHLGTFRAPLETWRELAQDEGAG